MSTNSPNQILNRVPAKLKARTINYQVGEGFMDEYAEGLGYVPFVWYNSYPLESTQIEFLELSIIDGLPTLKLTFRDLLGLMKDRAFPMDDTPISIFLNPRSKQLKPIHLDLKIIDFKIITSVVTCVSVLDVNRLYVKEFQSYKNLSSYEVLKKITSEIGLGFNSNVESSNDKMTWINTGKKVRNFFDDVIDNSYLGEQNFVMGYIDYYYNYNYVDLQKELKRNIGEEKGISDTGIQSVMKLENKDSLASLILSNDAAFIDSNVYFEKYTILNKSTSISLQRGYKSIIKYYNQLSKEYLFFNLDSLTDNADSKIILKGKPKDSKFKNQNFDYIYKGKLDTDNSHINYAYSQILNDRNLFDLEKISMEIELPIPNFNLYKFQKILVAISNQAKGVVEEFFNTRLSGEWLIIDIKYRLASMKFAQVITLVKRELEVSRNEKN